MRIILGQEHRLNASCCTACGRMCDAAMTIDADESPQPGDVTVCLTCGHVMSFDNNLGLRELTSEEAYNIAGDKRLLALQKARAFIIG